MLHELQDIRNTKYHSNYITVYFINALPIKTSSTKRKFSFLTKISFLTTHHLSLGSAMVVTTYRLRVNWLPSRPNIYISYFKTCSRLLWTAFRCTFLTQIKIDKTYVYFPADVQLIIFYYLWLAELPSSCPRSTGVLLCSLYSLQCFLLEHHIRPYQVTTGKIGHRDENSVLWYKKGIIIDSAVHNL
jgi:hypothetical protein